MEDSLKLYLKEIGPSATSEENRDLFTRYKNGEDLYQKIYEKNLRLVVKYALSYAYKHNLDPLDTIQNGNLGLAIAIQKYDLSKGISFSTYATNWILQSIARENRKTSKTIRLPDYLYDIHSKIRQYITEIEEEEKRTPPKEELKEKLSVTDDIIESFYNFKDITSLDKEIDEDMALKNIIGKEENYDEVESNIDLKIYLYKLKLVLTNLEYFCIYNAYIENKTIKEIAQMFKVSSQLIRQHIKNGLEKSKRELSRNKKIPIKEIEKLNLIPFSIEEYILLRYIKKTLTEEEYYIYYQVRIKGKNLDEIYIENIEKLYLNICMKEQEFNLLDKDTKFNLSKGPGPISSLFDIEPSYKEIPLKEVYTFFKEKTFEEIEKEYLETLNYKQIELLKRFFYHDVSSIDKKDIKEAEKEINLKLLGYRKSPILDFNILFETYRENRHMFSSKEKQVLDKLFLEDKIGISSYLIRILEKLEKIYFGIYNFKEIHFKISDIEELLERYPDKLKKDKEFITDVFLLKLTRKKLEEKYNLSRHQLIGKIKNMKIKLFNLKYDLKKDNKKELTDYIEYLKDSAYDIKNRNLALDYFNGMTYDELKEKYHISKTSVSNSIMDVIRRIEQYHFKITIPTYITEKELELLQRLGEEEVEILRDYYINRLEFNEVLKKYNIEEKTLKKLMKQAHNIISNQKVKEIKLKIDDYIEELDCHISDSVLEEKERVFVSYFYGIKYAQNTNGIKLDKDEILRLLGITDNIYYHLVRITTLKIKKRKAGLLNPIYGNITQKELIELLKDKNLPITEEDKILLSVLKGINKDIKVEELETVLNISTKSIQRKYNRAVLNILKYKESKINGNISYEKDIKPLLKYFSKYDTNLIELYFNQNKSYEKIQNITNETRDHIINRLQIIKRKIVCLIEENTDSFDFEYARRTVNDDTIPFYSDISLARMIYELRSGELGKPLSYEEIKEKLNLKMSISVIIRYNDQFMLSLCKHKLGFRKEKEISHEEIEDFYKNTKLSSSENQIFKRYLERKEIRYVTRNSKLDNINYIILKHQNKLPINLSNRRDLEKVLKYSLTKKTKRVVLTLLGRTEQDTLSGKEIEKILRLLTPIYKKEKIKSLKKQ